MQYSRKCIYIFGHKIFKKIFQLMLYFMGHVLKLSPLFIHYGILLQNYNNRPTLLGRMMRGTQEEGMMNVG
jgi:hypothetical protein